MTVEQSMRGWEERRKYETLWWAGTLIWTGLVFGAGGLDWLPHLGQADAWTWVFLGAGLYGLIGSLYRQASADVLNPRTWDYLWSGFLLIVGLSGVAGVNAFWPAALILAGVAYLVRILRRT